MWDKSLLRSDHDLGDVSDASYKKPNTPTIMTMSLLHRPSFCSHAKWAPLPSNSKMCLFLVGSQPILHVALANSMLLIHKLWLLHKWRMPNRPNICLQESQEFPLFLSPFITSSLSSFLESEHCPILLWGPVPSSVGSASYLFSTYIKKAFLPLSLHSLSP